MPQQVAKSRLGQAFAQGRQIAVNAQHGLLQALFRLGRLHARQLQQHQLDQPLRQHAQLAGAVHILRETGRMDDVPRHLAQALVAVHRSGAQDLERIVVGHLARAHQDALGTVHHLALLEAAAHVEHFSTQGLLAVEAGARQMDQRAQALRAIAVDDIGMNPHLHGAHDLVGIAIAGENNDGARRSLGNDLQRPEQLFTGQRVVTNHQVGGLAKHLLHQFAAPFGTAKDLDTDRFQVSHQGMRARRAVQIYQCGSHKNQECEGKTGCTACKLRTMHPSVQ